jgi:hypothetical protein
MRETAPRSALRVTVSGGDYQHTLDIDGYSARGVRIAYAALPVRQIFEAMLEERRFEGSRREPWFPLWRSSPRRE